MLRNGSVLCGVIATGQTLTVHVPITIRRHGGRKQIVSPDSSLL